MGIVRVNCFSISLDGYSAGPGQTLEDPKGVGGDGLHQWVFGERSPVDDEFFERSFQNVRAWILGRNMFAPSRGPWPPDDEWKGWWGDEPPYHCAVFVLTHHARPTLEMDGGTVFHFVDDAARALALAREAAGDGDVRIGGGADTVRQYVNADAIDEIHLAISPVVLGSGTSLFDGIDLVARGFRVAEHVNGTLATHVVLRRS